MSSIKVFSSQKSKFATWPRPARDRPAKMPKASRVMEFGLLGVAGAAIMGGTMAWTPDHHPCRGRRVTVRRTVAEGVGAGVGPGVCVGGSHGRSRGQFL